MTASERIRAARETHNSLVSALDQNPVETREEQRAEHIRRELATLRIPENSIHRFGAPRRFIPGT